MMCAGHFCALHIRFPYFSCPLVVTLLLLAQFVAHPLTVLQIQEDNPDLYHAAYVSSKRQHLVKFE
jgi:hypothetical protein